MTKGTLGDTIHQKMKPFRWSPEKNDKLVRERGISFEDITVAVQSDGLLEVVSHPNLSKYPSQSIMVVSKSGYVFLVPFVEESDHFFLKTIVPSRKATRDFLGKGLDDA